MASLSVSGQLGTFATEEEVKRTATWTAEVPHRVTRWVEVPYTTYETYSYSCGRGICQDTRPVTAYRSEPRDETEYRTEKQSRDYVATQTRVELSAQVNLFVDLRPVAKPLGTVLKEEKVDVSETRPAIAEANLPAQGGHVVTQAEWDQRMREAAATRLVQALAEHWRDAYCAAGVEEPEAAARCAYGGSPKAPELAVLTAFFHDDVSSLAAQPKFAGR